MTDSQPNGIDPTDRPGGVVLVVEDDPELLYLIATAIGETHSVITRANGQEGLLAAFEFQPDLVITDLVMPVIDGEGLLLALRADPRFASTPIMILTAIGHDATRLRLLGAGATDFLSKPVQLSELKARIRNLLALRRAERSNRAFELSDDRLRIAQDLHDQVIQRIFALGMRLTVVTRRMATIDEAAGSDLIGIAVELDNTIASIRSSIFDLRHRGSGHGLRSDIAALVSDAAERLGCRPRFTCRGALESLVHDEVKDDLLATLREALSNVVRHADASEVAVSVTLNDAELLLVVADNGVGLVGVPSGDGLGNMTARAERHGGSCALSPGGGGGSELRWSIPTAR